MFLPETLNAPRQCWLGGQVYWVRSLSLEGFGILVAWLDDVLPGREERKTPPRYGDDASQAALRDPAGEHLLVWLALRSQSVTWEQAGALADQMTVAEKARLGTVLLGRRRTWEPSPGGGTDLGELWTDKGWASLAIELGGLDKLGSLSLDQLEFLMARGDVDVDPAYNTENLARMQAEWRANQLPRDKELIEQLLAEKAAEQAAAGGVSAAEQDAIAALRAAQAAAAMGNGEGKGDG